MNNLFCAQTSAIVFQFVSHLNVDLCLRRRVTTVTCKTLKQLEVAWDPLKNSQILLVCECNLEVNNIPLFEVSLIALTEDQHFYVSKKFLFLNIFNVKPGCN